MSGDTLFNYVTCLVDESAAAAGDTYVSDLMGGRLNLSGSAAVTSAVTLFGRPTISLNLSGSADSVSISTNPFSFSGDTDGAAEFWIYPTSFASAGALISGESSGWGYNLWVSTAGQVGLHSDSAWSIPYAGSALSLNAWNHVALVLTSSTTMTVYVNGTPIGSTAVSNAAKIGTGGFSIGVNGAWGGVFRGYLGPVRVTKGAARYTAAFTPPTEAFPTSMASTDTSSGSSSSGSTTTTDTDPYFAHVTTLLDESQATNGDASVKDLISGALIPFSYGPTVTTDVMLFGRPTLNYNAYGYGLLPSSALDLSENAEATVEFWMYQVDRSSTTRNLLATGTNNGSMNGFFLAMNASGQLCLYAREYYVIGYAGDAVPLKTWTHIALAITNSTTATIYIGGKAIGSGTVSSQAQAFGATNVAFIGNSVYSDGTFVGNMGPLRITKGVARYRADFTPPTAAFPTVAGSTTYATDDYLDSVVLLLESGTDGSFADKSLNHATISHAGSSLVATPTKFGSVSLWAQFAYLSYLADHNLAADDFTIEGWVYLASAPSPYATLVGNLYDPSSGWRVIISPEMNVVLNGYWTGQSAIVETVGAKMVLNQWVHLAVVRHGNTITSYVNGVPNVTRVADTMGTINSANGTSLEIGGTMGGYWPFPGYVDSLRVTKGVARYLAGFTPPTAAFPTTGGALGYSGTAVSTGTDDYLSDVVLLLKSGADGTFTDKSTNAAALTYSGSGLVNYPSKFGSVSLSPQLTYLPHLAVYDLAGHDFTVEGWVLLKSYTSPSCAVVGNIYGGGGWRMCISPEGIPQIGAYWTEQALSSTVTGVVAPLKQWVHVACVRTGQKILSFVNGVLAQTSVGATGSIVASAGQIEIGGTDGSSWLMDGFIDSLRITVGTARYLADFTPPTAGFPTTQTVFVEDTTTGTDPYLSHVTVLMTLEDAAEGATTVHDTLGNTLTCENGVAVTLAKTHFGRPTMALTGAGNGRVLLAPVSALDLSGVNASTVECWLYPTSIPVGVVAGSYCAIISSGTSTGGMGGFFVSANSAGQVGLYMREYWCVAPGAAGTLKMNAWNHLAVCFVGATAYLFVNGALLGTGAISSANPALEGSDFAAVVGTVYSDATPAGYLGQFRVTEGIARYLAPFTRPTQAFPTTAPAAGATAADGAFGDVALLLHCDDAAFSDSSIHGFSPLSIAGISVSSSHALFGAGALHFDGTGNGLSYAHADALNLATIDFTVELAVYLPALGNYCLFQKDQHYGSTFTSYSAQAVSDGSVLMSVGTGGSGSSAQNIQTPAGTLTAGTLHRLAFVRAGKQIYIFVDGVLITADTQTASPADGASPLIFGYFPSGGSNNDWRLVGYLDEIRITRSARYTAGYTVDAQAFGSRKPYFSGTVLDESGAPAARTILAMRRDTCQVLATTTSSATDGSYKLETTYGGLHDLIAQDSTGNLADLIITRVTPV